MLTQSCSSTKIGGNMTPEQLDEYLTVIKKHKIENIKLTFEGVELTVTGLLPPEMFSTVPKSVMRDAPDEYSAIDELKD